MEYLIRRGDVVICAISGDYGKPRPAVVIQSDLFNSVHASITLCPITTYLRDAPLFRPQLFPNESNGLTSTSQVMVDKILTIKSEKIAKKIGQLANNEMSKLEEAIKLWLNLQ